jgi:hypothetical protein
MCVGRCNSGHRGLDAGEAMDQDATTGALGQADEDVLSYTVSDEALEAAAGTKMGALPTQLFSLLYVPPCHNC